MANPNPNTGGLKPFQPGVSGNPGGKTAEHRQLEVEAAEMAARIRHKMLSAVTVAIEGDEMATLEAIKSDLLRLMKDSEDRAHGTPKQAIQHGNDPDNPLPASIAVHFVKPDEQN
jgi:hypothetical protein